MTTLVLAALLVAGATPAASPMPSTLAGVTLGATLAQPALSALGAIRSDNPDGPGSLWTWKRVGGGVVSVLVDTSGTVATVHFVADKGEYDKVDLPCIGPFDLRGSHVNLNFAAVNNGCTMIDVTSFRLPDGSVFIGSFDGPGDGGLRAATWYRPLDK
jgi:hypothetical protein